MSNEHDPLAPLRRKEPQAERGDEAEQPPTPGEKVAAWFHDQTTNYEAVWSGGPLAEKIDAAITEAKADLEKAYQAGTERTKLEALASQMYDTLLLCEDGLLIPF